MCKYYNVEQNSEEWFSLRAGRIGGSSVGAIMANLGKAFGPPAKALAVKLAIERITGNKIDDVYSNAYMVRGLELEPVARDLYAQEQFVDVENGGYFQSDDWTGASPDGLVGDDGLIEIKSVVVNTHFDTIKRNSFDPAYKWQLLHNLFVSGREWIDFVSYCPDFPERRRLFVCRLLADDFKQERDVIAERIGQFNALVSECETVINNS